MSCFQNVPETNRYDRPSSERETVDCSILYPAWYLLKRAGTVPSRAWLIPASSASWVTLMSCPTRCLDIVSWNRPAHARRLLFNLYRQTAYDGTAPLDRWS